MESHPPSVPSVTSVLRRRLVPILAGAAVLTAGGIWLGGRQAPAAGGGICSVVTADGRDHAAAAALQGFLSSSTAAERAAFIIDAERLLPEMESYYAGMDPEPIAAADFKPMGYKFEQGSEIVAFKAERTRGLPAVVACVKNFSGRWLLDWELYRQTEDGLADTAMSTPAEGTHTLRVHITRQTPAGKPLVLTVADPFENRTITLPVSRPDLLALYAADLPVGSRHATIEFAWLNDSTTGRLEPQIRRHVCWGFSGLDDVAPAAPEAFIDPVTAQLLAEAPVSLKDIPEAQKERAQELVESLQSQPAGSAVLAPRPAPAAAAPATPIAASAQP